MYTWSYIYTHTRIVLPKPREQDSHNKRINERDRLGRRSVGKCNNAGCAFNSLRASLESGSTDGTFPALPRSASERKLDGETHTHTHTSARVRKIRKNKGARNKAAAARAHYIMYVCASALQWRVCAACRLAIYLIGAAMCARAREAAAPFGRWTPYECMYKRYETGGKKKK